MGFIFIALTIGFTVYGQLIMRYHVGQIGEFPTEPSAKFLFVLRQFISPYLLSSLVAGFLAAMSWMVVLSQLELNFAYPFTSLSFLIVMFLSSLFFGETLTLNKVVGTIIIIVGLYVLTRTS